MGGYVCIFRKPVLDCIEASRTFSLMNDEWVPEVRRGSDGRQLQPKLVVACPLKREEKKKKKHNYGPISTPPLPLWLDVFTCFYQRRQGVAVFTSVTATAA